MKKKGHRPITKVKNPEPKMDDPDWSIWAAWADRITFEEIEKKTGKKESDVIKIMRRSLKPSSFRLWRKRVNQKSIKAIECPDGVCHSHHGGHAVPRQAMQKNLESMVKTGARN